MDYTLILIGIGLILSGSIVGLCSGYRLGQLNIIKQVIRERQAEHQARIAKGDILNAEILEEV